MTQQDQPPHTWKAKAAEKYDKSSSAIPPAWRLPQSIWDSLKTPLEESKTNLIELKIVERSSILTKRELDITESYDVPRLLKELASGALTSVEVTTAFSKRAAIAQQLTQCLTETLFDQAIDRARHLDNLRSKGQLGGPLHGLPISVKDGFQIAGVPATLGLLAFINHVSTSNSCLVDVLVDLGAVLYVKTNIPQTLMTADSSNNVFGRVLNPRNTMVGAGGSSGGEGALVAFRGSPLGVGTDIGGSVRIPSLCCGTYGFKPTSSRVPYGGQISCANRYMSMISSVAGPLANDMGALGIFMRAVIGQRPAHYDSTAFDLPWRLTPPKPKLRLGVLPEDPRFPLHPPVKKAVAAAVDTLQSQGHEIVHLQEDECRIGEVWEVAWNTFGLDDRAARLVTDAHEPDIPSRIGLRNEWARAELRFLPDTGSMGEFEKWTFLAGKRAEVKAYWHKIWRQHQLDAVIGQAAQNSAVEHDTYGFPPYTTFLNLLDYPACIIPFKSCSGASLNEVFEVKGDQSGPPYHPETLEGLPCAIQVFTYTMQDEECLAIAEVVDKCLRSI